MGTAFVILMQVRKRRCLGHWKSESMVRRYVHMSVKHLAPYADRLTIPTTSGEGEKPSVPDLAEGSKNGHSGSRPRLTLVAGADLSNRW